MDWKKIIGIGLILGAVAILLLDALLLMLFYYTLEEEKETSTLEDKDILITCWEYKGVLEINTFKDFREIRVLKDNQTICEFYDVGKGSEIQCDINETGTYIILADGRKIYKYCEAEEKFEDLFEEEYIRGYCAYGWLIIKGSARDVEVKTPYNETVCKFKEIKRITLCDARKYYNKTAIFLLYVNNKPFDYIVCWER